MLDWPFLILEHDAPLGLSNIGNYLLHPLFLLISLHLGFTIVDRKIWGRISFFVGTIFLLGLFVDREWPIIVLPENHAFANFPKPILSLSVVCAYMGWMAWEYRQTALQWIGLGAIALYMYNLHAITPLEGYATLVTILGVMLCAALFEIIARIAKNYPQIIGLIVSVGTIPLIMKMQETSLLMLALQAMITSTSIGWLLAGSDNPSQGFRLRSLLTAFGYFVGAILLWIILGAFDAQKSEPYYAIALGAAFGFWSTAGLHHMMQFYSKK